METVSVNSNSVTLQWRPPETPNGVITHYSIQRNGTNTVNISSSVLMYTIEGLSPDTVYDVQLRAHTIVGAGPPTNETVLTRKFGKNSYHNGKTFACVHFSSLIQYLID